MTPTLKVNTELDGSRMIRGMNQMEGSVKNWSSAIKGYIGAAFSVAAITQLGRSTADYFAGVGDSAERLDMAVEKFQALVQIAKLAGKEIGDVERLLNSISNAQVEAITDPKSQAAKSFSSMGLSGQDLNTMGISGVVSAMAKVLSGQSRGQVRASTEGIVGSKDVGLFMSLSSSMANLTGVTDQLLKEGKITSEANIQALKKQQDELEVQWSILKTTILPAVTVILKLLNTVLVTFQSWWQTLKEVFTSITNVGIGDILKNPLGVMKDVLTENALTVNRIAAENYRKVVDIWSGTRPPVPEEAPNIPDTFQDVLEQMKDDLKHFKDKEPELRERIRGGVPSIPMSNFLGLNTGVINAIANDNIYWLKQIAKNTSYIKGIEFDAKDMFGVTL